MTETEFLARSEVLLTAVEKAIERSAPSLDSDRSGHVLTVSNDEGEQAVINLHAPTCQIWLASRRGGWHFSFEDDGRLLATREREDFWELLSRTVGQLAGMTLTLRPE